MFISLDRNSRIPIKKQLYDRLTYMILNNELAYGQKLPSSRELSRTLKIARNTVVEVYEQLIAELYIATRKGSGTFVTSNRKCKLCKEPEKPREEKEEKCDCISLIAGTPDLNHFPTQQWMQSTRRTLHHPDSSIFGYGNPNGYLPLRKSLAKYLNTHKGIKCCHEQIIISSGTKDAIRLIALSMKDRTTSLLCESPCVQFVPEIFGSLDYDITPLSTDNTGIITSRLPKKKNAIIYTSAAHHFPLGGTLTCKRRHDLINYAEANNHYIIEDDCDSEFRYKGAPVNSLYQICAQYVIHLGTFSKTICPSLRLGYIVLPPNLTEISEKFTELIGNPPGTIIQSTVNDLILSGDYEKHIYKMTKIYKIKNKVLLEHLAKIFGDSIVVNGDHTGLHIALKFKDYTFKNKDIEIFKQHKLKVEFSNEYSIEKSKAKDNRLILSYAHLEQAEIIDVVNKLKSVHKALLNQT